MLVVPVGYRFTGELLNTVKNNDYIVPIGGAIPAQTPMFGIPMSKPTGISPHPELMWCAAMTGSAPGRWKIVCLPKELNAVRWIDAGVDLFPATVFIPLNGMPATTPQIKEKEIDIPLPLTAAIQFGRWSGDGADVYLGIRQPDSRTPIGIHVSGDHRVATLHLKTAADGACHLGIFGGELAIRPTSDGKSAAIEIVKAFPVVSTLAPPSGG